MHETTAGSPPPRRRHTARERNASADFVNAESGAFNLAPNGTAMPATLTLKTTLIK